MRWPQIARFFLIAYLVATAGLVLYLHSHRQAGDFRFSFPSVHVNMGADHQMHHQSQKEAHIAIPKIIHQTWKDENVPANCIAPVQSWKQLNPDYTYKFYTDRDIDQLIHERHPELKPLYARMSPIMKADLFRYLILYDEGGVYADIDVECAQPIDEWQWRAHAHFNVGMMVGFEVITGKRPDWRKWFARKHQMCQWTIASIPQHPILARVIDNIWAEFDNRTDAQVQQASAVDLTGPAVWSDAVTGFFDEEFGVEFGVAPFESDSLRDNFYLVGDVLLLPLRAFGTGSAGYVAPPNFPGNEILIHHNFQGSWKKKPAPPSFALPDPEVCDVGPSQAEACVRGYPEVGYGIKAIMDGDVGTVWRQPWKYDDKHTKLPIVLTLQSPDAQPFVLKTYELIVDDSAPTAWTVYGATDKAGTWVKIDAREAVDWSILTDQTFSTTTATPFAFYRFNFTASSNSNDRVLTLNELILHDLPKPLPPTPVCGLYDNNVTACACCGGSTFGSKEGPAHALDGSNSTKWHVQWEPSQFYDTFPWLSIVFPDAVELRSYAIRSADDFELRDPANWTLLVQEADSHVWETVDERFNQTFAQRHELKHFALAKPVRAQAIKLKLTALRDASHLQCRHTFCTQIGEWRLETDRNDQLPSQHQLSQES